MIPRWCHRAFVFVAGYFWLPCPRCGRMFGGHERHGRSLPTGSGTFRACCERHR